MNAKAAAVDRKSPLEVRTGLRPQATRDISGALNALLADRFGDVVDYRIRAALTSRMA